MKFDIIGTGFIFPRHVMAIRKAGGVIGNICNKDFGENYWKDMLDYSDSKYVVILTPNDLHYQMAEYAAKLNKIVLCEKPLCTNLIDVVSLAKYKNIFTVLQLRHHELAPILEDKIREEEKYDVEMDISVYRDQSYFDGWKGKDERSGGILYNLGVHYFDMLVYLFGEPTQIKDSHITNDLAWGEIKGKNYNCKFHLCTRTPKDQQKRVFKINGQDYNFSSKDNLSQEDLHYKVYEDLLKGEGITPDEARRSTKLIEQLKNHAKN